MSEPMPALRFHGARTFQALDAAERFLASAGFSFGPGCAGCPTCIMYGDYLVAKWRNLRPGERIRCHGLMTGDRRYGPVHIELTDACPPDGVAAFIAAGSELEGIG